MRHSQFGRFWSIRQNIWCTVSHIILRDLDFLDACYDRGIVLYMVYSVVYGTFWYNISDGALQLEKSQSTQYRWNLILVYLRRGFVHWDERTVFRTIGFCGWDIELFK